MQQVVFQDLGCINYQEAWDHQTRLHKELIERKRRNRKLQETGQAPEALQHYFLLCEHPPVYTLGKSGSLENLLLSEEQLSAKGFQFFKINRGGDITYHGPGQIVGYPIFDLEGFFTDVHRYVRFIEEAIIRTIAEYGLKGIREKGYTGVWLESTNSLPARKICAIGVHLSRWVSMHGFAFNVNTTIDHFNNIIPCGIADENKAVTSLEKELGRWVDLEEVKAKVKAHFAALFEFRWREQAEPGVTAL